MRLSEKFLNKLSRGAEILSLIEDFHKQKFPNIDVDKQERKFLGEMAEFQSSTTEDEKVEEAVDVIISAIGFIKRCGKDSFPAIITKFCKVLDSEYPDEYQHKEDKNGKV